MTQTGYDTAIPGNGEHWAAMAAEYREALRVLNIPTVDCLPGDPHWCGQTIAHHCLGYMAALKAHAEYSIRHMGPGADEDAEILYEHWLATFINADRQRGGCDQQHDVTRPGDGCSCDAP